MNQVQAVIFDWAGTTVDFGSFAPTTIFVEAFKKAFDFDITLGEARGPMGLGKLDHIMTLGNEPLISQRWAKQFGKAFSSQDADAIYETFMPLQVAKVTDHADLIPGTLETMVFLRQKDIKIGSCSGYPRVVMEALVPAAKDNGYSPDCIVASDDIEAGSRPGPWMALKNVIELGVEDVKKCIKVDDSAPGIYEGKNAGMWTVGLALSGNESGLTLDGYLNASASEKDDARTKASISLKQAGADYVIDTIAELPKVVLDIESRLAAGDKP